MSPHEMLGEVTNNICWIKYGAYIVNRYFWCNHF